MVLEQQHWLGIGPGYTQEGTAAQQFESHTEDWLLLVVEQPVLLEVGDGYIHHTALLMQTACKSLTECPLYSGYSVHPHQT